MICLVKTEDRTTCSSTGYYHTTQQPDDINQPNNQPVNQLVNQPVDQLVNQLVNQPVNQPVNQLVNQPVNQPVNQLVNQSTTGVWLIIHINSLDITISNTFCQSKFIRNHRSIHCHRCISITNNNANRQDRPCVGFLWIVVRYCDRS